MIFTLITALTTTMTVLFIIYIEKEEEGKT
jgi:hypothetical protein